MYIYVVLYGFIYVCSVDVKWILPSGNQTWQLEIPMNNGGFLLAKSCTHLGFPTRHVWLPVARIRHQNRGSPRTEGNASCDTHLSLPDNLAAAKSDGCISDGKLAQESCGFLMVVKSEEVFAVSMSLPSLIPLLSLFESVKFLVISLFLGLFAVFFSGYISCLGKTHCSGSRHHPACRIIPAYQPYPLLYTIEFGIKTYCWNINIKIIRIIINIIINHLHVNSRITVMDYIFHVSASWTPLLFDFILMWFCVYDYESKLAQTTWMVECQPAEPFRFITLNKTMVGRWPILYPCGYI